MGNRSRNAEVDVRQQRRGVRRRLETVGYLATRVVVWVVVAALFVLPVLATLVKNSIVEVPASLLPTVAEASVALLVVLLLLCALSVYTTFLMLHKEPYSILWLPAFFGAVGTTLYIAYALLGRLVL